MHFKILFFGASKLVSTKNPLLKHDCRSQGFPSFEPLFLTFLGKESIHRSAPVSGNHFCPFQSHIEPPFTSDF